jgi:hypothetical protein
VGALAVLGCASGYPFVRPTVAGKPSIRNEATGTSYDDCKAAFSDATADTVLTFSEGVFACGPEVSAMAGWLVLRGAGLGHTFLEYGDPVTKTPKPLRLTAIKPFQYLRVEDLAFGGVTELPGEEGRVEIVRAALATERPALFGGPGARMDGSAVVIHSVLAGWTATQRPADGLPKPIAIDGTEHVALLESIVFDVEQEFERFPAPGSIVLLSDGVQKSFQAHQPAAQTRADPSPRPNLACGTARNPAVVCGSESQSPSDPSPLGNAARSLWGGAGLAAIEPMLREEAKGFADRFGKSLGSGIRQPEVYWFDDAAAQVVEDESQLPGKDAIAVLARPRSSKVVAQCGNPDQNADSIAAAITTAKTLDRLLAGPTVETACREALKTRVATLVAACKESWDWAPALTGVTTVDGALGTGTQGADECRKAMVSRLPDAGTRGLLAEAYLREVNRALHLGMSTPGADPIPSISPVSKLLPWIRLRAVRSLKPAATPTILDRLLHAAQVEGAGDGRELVETTAPCSLSVSGGGARATTVVELGELPRSAKVGQNPHTVVTIPVQATQDDLAGQSVEGSQASAILAACERKTETAFESGVRRYFVDELVRLLPTTTGAARSDVVVTLQLIRMELGESSVFKDEPMPVVLAALKKIGDNIRSQPLDAAQVASHPDDSPLLLRVPPDWTIKDYELGADQLSHATMASIDACELAMPDVPWHRDKDGGVRGPVNLEKQPVYIRCLPKEKDKAFDLGIRSETDVKPQEVDTIMRTLNAHLSWPKNQKIGGETALVWASKGGRNATLFTHSKKGTDLMTVTVPIGSSWPK